MGKQICLKRFSFPSELVYLNHCFVWRYLLQEMCVNVKYGFEKNNQAALCLKIQLSSKVWLEFGKIF